MKDLFENYQELPAQVVSMINSFNERSVVTDDIYANCEQLVKELELLGYTCEYGLDGVPFNLKKVL